MRVSSSGRVTSVSYSRASLKFNILSMNIHFHHEIVYIYLILASFFFTSKNLCVSFFVGLSLLSLFCLPFFNSMDFISKISKCCSVYVTSA